MAKPTRLLFPVTKEKHLAILPAGGHSGQHPLLPRAQRSGPLFHGEPKVLHCGDFGSPVVFKGELARHFSDVQPVTVN
jgi:hypothetical protein